MAVITRKEKPRQASMDFINQTSQICESPEFLKPKKMPYLQYKKKKDKFKGFSDGTPASYHNQDDRKFNTSGPKS